MLLSRPCTTKLSVSRNHSEIFLLNLVESNLKLSAYRFGQATLVHVLVACAPLPASTGMVHGPWGTGHPVTVVAGVGRVVGSVGMVVVVVVAADGREEHEQKRKS